jgi:hypothetical protein
LSKNEEQPGGDPLLPVNYCTSCRLVHPPIATCAEAQSVAMLGLLHRIGKQDSCRGCAKTIYWVRHANGANTPYTEVGLNHFIDCPEREAFKRKGHAKRTS